jgi:hypothetical protein
MRVIASLAYQVQTSGIARNHRAPIVMTWGEMEAKLPETWDRQQRKFFLAWLAEYAGILVDNADGTVAFSHLSFQEYLTAWHFNETLEQDARVKLCVEKMHNEEWWETLRLWAALIQRGNPSRLEPIFRELLKDETAGVWLAGAMLADGLGSDAAFLTWLQRLAEILAYGMPRDVSNLCAQAWSLSRQTKRRRDIRDGLEGWTSQGSWLHWIRCGEWGNDARLDLRAVDPGNDSMVKHIPPAPLAAGFVAYVARSTSLGRFTSPSARELAGNAGRHTGRGASRAATTNLEAIGRGTGAQHHRSDRPLSASRRI